MEAKLSTIAPTADGWGHTFGACVGLGGASSSSSATAAGEWAGSIFERRLWEGLGLKPEEIATLVARQPVRRPPTWLLPPCVAGSVAAQTPGLAAAQPPQPGGKAAAARPAVTAAALDALSFFAGARHPSAPAPPPGLDFEPAAIDKVGGAGGRGAADESVADFGSSPGASAPAPAAPAAVAAAVDSFGDFGGTGPAAEAADGSTPADAFDAFDDFGGGSSSSPAPAASGAADFGGDFGLDFEPAAVGEAVAAGGAVEQLLQSLPDLSYMLSEELLC